MAPCHDVDGDLVIIRRDATVENGKIAAVSVDGGATLKRIFRYSDEIELESANIRYPTRVRFLEAGCKY